MHALIVRMRGLARRYRSDRRLPPPVASLVRDLVCLTPRALGLRWLAMIRPPSGCGDHAVAVLGARRLRTAGPLDTSLDELSVCNATSVVDALAASGVDTFVVDRRDASVVLAVGQNDRDAAYAALTRGLDGQGWFVEWIVGNRRRTTALRRAPARIRRRARTWRVFRAHAWGRSVIGPTSAVEVTFWEAGTSRRIELVGTRGNSRYDERSPRSTVRVRDLSFPGRVGFPVGQNLEHVVEPIDIVITWVDGADPAWRSSMAEWAIRFGRSEGDEALNPARFHSRDELRYVLRSIWAYCGWVRRIYLVTSGQVPSWLESHDRISLVDHREILPADVLPTFNSHAIETGLHRIEGLSERFIYFNDDVFVARHVEPETFFTSSGLPKVFPSDALVPGYEGADTISVDRAAIRGRELLARRYGRTATYKPHHVAFPHLRSVAYDVEREFADAVARTRRNRFRAADDLSTLASFTQSVTLATGKGVISDVAVDYVYVESARLKWHLRRLALRDDFDMFCVNETDQGDTLDPRREAMISSFLESSYPQPAPWERES